MDISALAKNVVDGVQKNSPTILTGLAVVGVIGTAYLVNRAAFYSGLYVSKEVVARNMAAIEEDPTSDGVPDPSFKEIVQMTWKNYIPAAFVAAGTIACVVGAHGISNHRNVALASALTLSEIGLREYREKTEEILGEENVQKVREAITQDKVDKTPLPTGNREIILTDENQQIFFETLTGRYFVSTRHDVESAEVEANRQMLSEMYISKNEWFDRLGLDRIPDGDGSGWNNDKPLDIQFGAVFRDGRPVTSVEYRFLPDSRFSTFG